MREGELMKRALESKLRSVRLRCGLNVLLRQMGVVLSAGGAAAATALAAERLFAISLVNAWTAWSALAVGLGLLAVLCALRAPRRMQVALLIDRRLAFRERFSTALALGGSGDAFARAAVEEAHRAAEGLTIRTRFPIRPTWHWLSAGGSWAAALAVFLFLPNLDVLGHLAQQKRQQQEAAQLAQARTEVNQVVGKVQAAVQQVQSKALEGELAKLAMLGEGAQPAEVRRDAIRKLGDLAEKLRDLQKSEPFSSADKTRQMLKDLKNNPGGLSRELNRAIANSEFQRAAEMLKDLLNQANDAKLSNEQKEALARQLGDLARQLEKIADAQKQQASALKEAGLAPDTAEKLAQSGLSEGDLREALKKQGLTDEQIDELMEKLRAAQDARKDCGRLAQALAKCRGLQGELIPAELVGLIEVIEGMQSMDGELAALEDALDEIDRACGLLGEGDLAGLIAGDMVGPYAEGDSNRPGSGLGGGPGKAWGNRPTGEAHPTALEKTGVKNKPSDGPIVASWYFKGPQAKGETKRQLKEVVQAAKDAAAEAVTDNKVPRKYEGAVRKYFGDFEQAATDANSP